MKIHSKLYIRIFLLFALCLSPRSLYATCSSLTSGIIEVKVNSCLSLSPVKGSNSYKTLPDWIHDLDPVAKKKSLMLHTGSLLKVHVTESKAINTGLNTAKGALKGTDINIFVHRSTKYNCKNIKKFVVGNLKEQCCDGGGNAPCLWKTGYYFKELKTSNKSKIKGSGYSAKQLTPKMKKLYSNRKYDAIIKGFSYRSHEFPNDVQFNYFLGMSYFKKEDCNKSKKQFGYIFNSYGKGKANLAYKAMIREAIFNLALCEAKEGNAANSTNILNGMKLDKATFGKEIKRARYHPDFGRIKNTKEWKNFMKD